MEGAERCDWMGRVENEMKVANVERESKWRGDSGERSREKVC